MRFSISVNLGRTTVGCEAEGSDPKEILRQVESCSDDLVSLVRTGRTIEAQMQTASPGAAHISSGDRPADMLASRIGDLQKVAQIEQLVAILYSKFLDDPNSCMSPSQIVGAFGDSGFLRPANPSDTIQKATRRGWVTKAEKGKYRLTVPGQRHAEALLQGPGPV